MEAEARRVGDTYMIRRLLGALFLTSENFATFQDVVENKATVDVHGRVISCYQIILWLCVTDLHIGVGFCVARSDDIGQYEGFQTWDG